MLKQINRISYIDKMNINKLDLNLLKVFSTLYDTGNVTRAGERMGLAQSSMSNALNRLREQFDDPLFQRTPQGMLPTARAQQLAPQIESILSGAERLLEAQTFVPEEAVRQITIASSDLFVSATAPGLMARLSALAPGISLNFVALDKQRLEAQLDSQQIDFAVGTFDQLPARFHRRQLAREAFICIAASQHPNIGHRLSLERYTSLRHVLVTLNADSLGAVDTILAKQGLTREIAMICAQFSAAVEVVAKSQLIATVPSAVKEMAMRAGCRVIAVPLEIPSWSTELVQTQQTQSSQLYRFVAGQIDAAITANKDA